MIKDNTGMYLFKKILKKRIIPLTLDLRIGGKMSKLIISFVGSAVVHKLSGVRDYFLIALKESY